MTRPHVEGPSFRRVETVEFDVVMTEDDVFPTRLELFQSLEDPQVFRVRLWQIETFRIQPLFPCDPTSGKPTHPTCDEEILLDRTHYLHADFEPSNYRAGSVDEALAMARAAFDRALRFWGGIRAAGDGRRALHLIVLRFLPVLPAAACRWR